MSQYQLDTPYPVPKNLKPNTCYANILLDNYSGACSELTAITQYIYYHLEAAENKQLSDALRGIAVVEMRHLDLLGGVIRQLGMPPRFLCVKGGRTNWWSAGSVSYGCTLKEMLQGDIQGEAAAIRNYQNVIRRVGEPQIQALIERIIQDEVVHLEHLQSLLDSL